MPIRIAGFVKSDGRHLTLLKEDGCNRGIMFDLSKATPQSDAKAIDDAIWQHWETTLNKEIRAFFTGTLKRPGNDGDFPYHLHVTRVDKVMIKFGKNPWEN